MTLTYTDRHSAISSMESRDGFALNGTGQLALVSGWRIDLAMAFAASKGLTCTNPQPAKVEVVKTGKCGHLEHVIQKMPIRDEMVICSCGSRIVRRDGGPGGVNETLDHWRARVQLWKLDHPGVFVSDKPSRPA